MKTPVLFCLGLLLTFFLSGCVTAHDGTFEDYFNSGMRKYSNRDFDGAIADWTKALELRPNSEITYTYRGIAKADKEDFDGAIEDYNKAIQLNSADFFAYNNRGNSWQAKGDFDRAIVDYNKAISIKPDYAAAYDNRGAMKDDKGDFDSTIADYNKAIALKPSDAFAYHNRGNAKQSKGDFDGAIADYNAAIELIPDKADSYASRGNAKQAKGDFDGAISDYQKSIALEKIKLNDMLNTPDNTSLYFHFFYNLTLCRLHRDASPAGLSPAVANQQEGWPKAVGQYLLGELSEAVFLAKASEGDAKISREHQCEAFYYAGMIHLLANESTIAREFFEKCISTKTTSFDEFHLAGVELTRLAEQH